MKKLWLNLLQIWRWAQVLYMVEFNSILNTLFFRTIYFNRLTIPPFESSLVLVDVVNKVRSSGKTNKLSTITYIYILLTVKQGGIKMVLDTSLLNTQQYMVRIKGKVEQSRKKVAAIEKGACNILALDRAVN